LDRKGARRKRGWGRRSKTAP